MTHRMLLLAIAASALLLAGCTQAPPPPAGLDPATVQAIINQQNADWWTSMFPDAQQPVIDPIETTTVTTVDAAIQNCMLSAIPGTFPAATGGNMYIDPAVSKRALFVCSLQYPLDLSDPVALGYLSQAQLLYLYDYYSERLVPCLTFIGFSFSERPSLRSYLSGGAGYWMPYYDMRPIPTADQWSAIDLRCPPPPYFANARPPAGAP